MENLKEMENKIKNTNNHIKKIIFIFIIALLLQIPLIFITGIVSNRERDYNSSSDSVGKEWGDKQTVAAPMLIVEIKKIQKDQEYISKKIILPDELNIDVNINGETRTRGIYETNVYNSNLKATGYFDSNKIPKDYENIYLSFGLTDTKALTKINNFEISNMKNLKLESGTRIGSFVTNGFSSESLKNIDLNSKLDFNIDVEFRGHDVISLRPFGENNNFSIKSNWKDPSFIGMLPESKEISENGFEARWTISHLVRNYPQVIDLDKDNTAIYSNDYYFNEENYDNTDVNVKLIKNITAYRLIDRASNYALLFIMLSLVFVYIFDISTKNKTHYIQYTIIGFSLVVFYLLLLALSEHLSFGLSYILSTLAIIIPNSLYFTSITENKRNGVLMAVMFVAVYAILFSILKMERYALLCGTILIFITLYIVMYITRKSQKYL